jgi:hypothetical protein
MARSQPVNALQKKPAAETPATRQSIGLAIQ